MASGAIADRIVHQRSATTIRDMVEFDAELIAELDHRQMAGAARADRPVGDAPGLAFAAATRHRETT
jgi:hypothetical protein